MSCTPGDKRLHPPPPSRPHSPAPHSNVFRPIDKVGNPQGIEDRLGAWRLDRAHLGGVHLDKRRRQCPAHSVPACRGSSPSPFQQTSNDLRPFPGPRAVWRLRVRPQTLSIKPQATGHRPQSPRDHNTVYHHRQTSSEAITKQMRVPHCMHRFHGLEPTIHRSAPAAPRANFNSIDFGWRSALAGCCPAS